MKNGSLLITLMAALCALLACKLVEEDINDNTMLDGNLIIDSALIDSSYYLISDSIPKPTALQKTIPVIVAAHGFTASSYEWLEFRQYADSVTDIMVSLVVLGGHGSSYKDFKKSTWEKWQGTIIKEYQALVKKGFENISLMGSSTGGTLILEMLGSNKLNNYPAPKHLILVDPIIIPGNKLLSLINLVGPIIGNDINKGTDEEMQHWYSNRPSEALSELMDLIVKVRKQLESGITLPRNATMTVFKAKSDKSADPVSALIIYKGVRDSQGRRIDVRIVDSKKHVFTRGAGRSSSWTDKDTQLQYKTFKEIRKIVKNSPP